MRFLDINKIEPGMILVKPIYDKNGNILLQSNTKITSHYLNKIKGLGFQKLYVYDKFDSELSKDIVYGEVVSEKLRQDAIKNLKTLNLDAVTFYANQLVSELVSASDILIDLSDIRNFHNSTYEHSLNVALMAVTVGIGMGLNNDQLKSLSIGAILHDIGKTAIDKEILDKPGKLTDEEYAIMKKHPNFGYNMLKDNDDISSLSRVTVLLHHENEDGSGYPFGRTGDKIPLFAKIVHVVDVFDALISERSYKKPNTPSDALEYLMGNCGTMFDEDVVNIFIKYIAIYPLGSTVLLSDGRKAIVEKNYSDSVLRPLVFTEDNEVLDLRNDLNCLNITIIDLVKDEF